MKKWCACTVRIKMKRIIEFRSFLIIGDWVDGAAKNVLYNLSNISANIELSGNYFCINCNDILTCDKYFNKFDVPLLNFKNFLEWGFLFCKAYYGCEEGSRNIYLNLTEKPVS